MEIPDDIVNAVNVLLAPYGETFVPGNRRIEQGVPRLLSTEERELLQQVFVQKLPYREIAKRSCLRESAIAMRVMRLRKKILKICLKRGILCERPEKNVSWA